MGRILFAFPLALFFCARAADAGQVLTYSEEFTRTGKTHRSAVGSGYSRKPDSFTVTPLHSFVPFVNAMHLAEGDAVPSSRAS